MNLIGMAKFIFVKSKKNPAGRVGIPYKGFDVGVCKYKLCPSDRSDLHGLRCRKTLKDTYLSAVSLRVSAQILSTIQAKFIGPDTKEPVK